MKILGIETSCDETAAAVVEDGITILTSVVATSAEMHRKYGGIVPEVAARKQVESIIPVLTEAMEGFSKDAIDAIAVTVGPGLIGSLLVGVETAKTLAFTWNKPIIPVNHVIAHMYANFVSSNKQKAISVIFPAISLVVSGGHTELYLMKNEHELTWLGGTLDDAAGEAFDKAARLLGFENRGGPAIAAAAQSYSSNSVRSSQPSASNTILKLPRPLMYDDTLNFSFSGLKTAILREWNKVSVNSLSTADHLQLMTLFSHEIQEAITDVLVFKTMKAVEKYSAKSVLISGGVAANTRLREKFNQQLTAYCLSLIAPSGELCTDNAATIAACAYYQNKQVNWKEITAQPDLSVEVAI